MTRSLRRSFFKGGIAGLGFVLAVTSVALAAVFNQFGPATGILKGSAATPITTAATSADITALWTGTCDATTFLRGDGACTAGGGGGGGGSVTSVGITAPSVFGVSGSPVTTSGTLALTFATGQTANRVLASPDGSTGAVALRALVAADLPLVPLTTGVTGILPGANGGTANGFLAFTGPTTSLKTFTLPNATATILTSNALVTVPQGGLGVGTITGLMKGNGTSAVSAASSPDVVGLWSGTCSASTFLRGDGSCQSVAGSGTVTSVGLSAPSVFGVASSPVTGAGTLTLSFASGQSANSILATPDGVSGALGLRSIVGGDLPAINLAVGGGGGVTGNLPVTNLNGGTSASSATYWRGDGSWAAPTVGPAGSNTQVQYNNSGALGASAKFVWDDSSSTLSLGGGTAAATAIQAVVGGGFNSFTMVPAASSAIALGRFSVVPAGTTANGVAGSSLAFLGGASSGTGTAPGGAVLMQGGASTNAKGGGITLTPGAGTTTGDINLDAGTGKVLVRGVGDLQGGQISTGSCSPGVGNVSSCTAVLMSYVHVGKAWSLTWRSSIVMGTAGSNSSLVTLPSGTPSISGVGMCTGTGSTATGYTASVVIQGGNAANIIINSPTASTTHTMYCSLNYVDP